MCIRDSQKVGGLVMFSGIVIFCFYSFIYLKDLLPVAQYGHDAIFFILLDVYKRQGHDRRLPLYRQLWTLQFHLLSQYKSAQPKGCLLYTSRCV